MNYNSFNKYESHFKTLIKEEREAEFEFHLNEIELLTGRQREKKGRAILGVNGRDAGTGLGNSYLVKFTGSNSFSENEISIGDIVIISKNKPTGKEQQGTVTKKTKRSITVSFNATPDYNIYGNNLRIDLFSNDITFQRMENALKLISKNNILKERVLLNFNYSNNINNSEISLKTIESLNNSQLEAINAAVQSEDIFLIHGPPGTGKTTTLTYLIKNILEQKKKKILVTASSNTAVDNLVEKLNGLGLPLLRIGNPARVDEQLLKLSLDYKIQDQPEYQQANSLWNKIQLLKKQQDDFVPASGKNRRGLSDDKIIQMAQKKQSYRGINPSKIRKMANWLNLQKTINKHYEDANKLQEKAIHDLLDKYNIICTTNSSAGSDLLKDFTFDIACIDEATQSTEPETLIPLSKSKKWILAGDHKQLPPTVISNKAQPLKISLFERMHHKLAEYKSKMLTIQYRMNEQIMGFSSKQFYSNKLIAHPSAKNKQLKDISLFEAFPYRNPLFDSVVSSKKPISILHISGSEKQNPGSFSYYNESEIKYVKEATDLLLSSRLFPEDVGIISPYDAQVNKLKQELKDYKVDVKSIDGYQGREKEVIIISFVRSNNNGDIGFLRDYRRLNVALTRAKKKLILIGDFNLLTSNTMYNKLVQYVDGLT